jgi:hypothetical protein
MKNIFINSNRYFVISIGFLLLFSFIPYLHNNVYGQLQLIIQGNGCGQVTCVILPPPQVGPSSVDGTIHFDVLTDVTFNTGFFNVTSSKAIHRSNY